MEPTVSIILLNWNTAEETIECLESIFDIKYDNYHIIIVDNNSENESLNIIKQYLNGQIDVNSDFVDYNRKEKPLHWNSYDENRITSSTNYPSFSHDGSISIIENNANYGFPGGNNIGARYALEGGSDYILFLNNDVVVDDEFLDSLVDTAECDESIGVVGSKIYYYDDPNRIQSFGGDMLWWMFKPIDYGMGEMDTGQYSNTKKRDFVWATSQLISSNVLEQVGLMDEKFFFGIEEYDLCERVRRADYDVVVDPESHVWHKGHASANKLDKFKSTKEKIRKESGLLDYKLIRHALKKHYGPIRWFPPFILRYIWVFSMAAYRRIYSRVGKFESDENSKNNI